MGPKHVLDQLQNDGRIGLLDFGSVGRLDPTARSARRQLSVAFDRQDPAAARDALVEILVPSADVDEQRLERSAISSLTTWALRPRVTPSCSPPLPRLVPDHGLSVPPDVAAVFRCLATLEGTLTHVIPASTSSRSPVPTRCPSCRCCARFLAAWHDSPRPWSGAS